MFGSENSNVWGNSAYVLFHFNILLCLGLIYENYKEHFLLRKSIFQSILKYLSYLATKAGKIHGLKTANTFKIQVEVSLLIY